MPLVADQAPTETDLVDYDLKYLRLLDADAEGVDWAEAARTVPHVDPSDAPERARRAWETYSARAKWLMEHGYQNLAQRRGA
jgi:hypothetical protein